MIKIIKAREFYIDACNGKEFDVKISKTIKLFGIRVYHFEKTEIDYEEKNRLKIK